MIIIMSDDKRENEYVKSFSVLQFIHNRLHMFNIWHLINFDTCGNLLNHYNSQDGMKHYMHIILRELAQHIRTLIFLVEVPDSVNSTHIVGTSSTSQFLGSDILLPPQESKCIHIISQKQINKQFLQCTCILNYTKPNVMKTQIFCNNPGLSLIDNSDYLPDSKVEYSYQ